MRRIKIGDDTAFDNLVVAEEIAIGQDGKPFFLVAAKHPKTLIEWLAAFRTSSRIRRLVSRWRKGSCLSGRFCALSARDRRGA